MSILTASTDRIKLRNNGELYSVTATLTFSSPVDVFLGSFGALLAVQRTLMPWPAQPKSFLPASNLTFLPPVAVDGRHATYEFHPFPNELTIEEVGQFHQFAKQFAEGLAKLNPVIGVELRLTATSGSAKFGHGG